MSMRARGYLFYLSLGMIAVSFANVEKLWPLLLGGIVVILIAGFAPRK